MVRIFTLASKNYIDEEMFSILSKSSFYCLILQFFAPMGIDPHLFQVSKKQTFLLNKNFGFNFKWHVFKILNFWCH